MRLRGAEEYSIGIDLGTGSVGWAAVDDKNGEPFKEKAKPTIGSRIFPNAETAADTRTKRSGRRRYARRRQRLDALQEIFAKDMEGVDPTFFIRLRQSRLAQEDRTVGFAADKLHALFNEGDFTEKEYYAQFPTIWHLRKHLMSSDEKADLRLVYLALHNILKHRGNFLRENEPSLTAANASAEGAAEDLSDALVAYTETLEGIGEPITFDPDSEALTEVLEKTAIGKANRAEEISDALHSSNAKCSKAISRAIVGYKVEFANIFPDLEKQEGTNAYLDDDAQFDALIALCSDYQVEVLMAMKAANSALTLSSLLSGENSLSSAMIQRYEEHKNDLAILKELVKEYCDIDVYRQLFRGPKTAQGNYDINKLPKGSYTAYIAGDKLANKNGCTHEELISNIRSIVEDHPAMKVDEKFKKIEARLMSDDGVFLAKQKTRSNGAIPYQLHLEELLVIVDKQGKHYPFLLENCEKLAKIVSSRIPYYVGPLNAQPDPNGPFLNNRVDESRKFAWSVRQPGKEKAKAYPWNYEDVIDIDETAQRFILRMTGLCTYLYGEPVLPRHSLLYEEFCVLNELNGSRYSEPGKEAHRFDAAQREGIIKDLFMKKRSVSYKDVSEWLLCKEGFEGTEVVGGQGERGFESKLESYNDFCRILDVSSLDDPSCALSKEDIERIILWSTIFEDRSIMRRKVEQEFGDVLDEEQIKRIVKNRYSGWGRLSKKLLCEIRTQTPLGRMSIMDILRDGDPTTGHYMQTMIFMEILHDKQFGFQERIDHINKEHLEQANGVLSVDEMPGSPALRRSVNQAMRIIDELVKVAGNPPTHIYIESTRDEDLSKKGSRTKKRYESLQNAIKAYKADAEDFDPELLNELKEKKDLLDNEKLFLYFSQMGKSLYSGEKLDINQLSLYQVDHIIPQAYIKDDSFDNKALVLQSENQRKLDSLLLDGSIIRRQRRWWDELHRAGLISDKKYRSLTTTDITDRRMTGFINRQLVETSQVVKFVRQMCEQKYPGTEVVSIKANISHNIREANGLPKVRELNNYHHAHDAFLACQVGRFLTMRFPKWQDGFQASLMRNHIKDVAREYSKSKKMMGRSGFFADAFTRVYKDPIFDPETGEVYKEPWNGEAVLDLCRKVFSAKEIFVTRMLLEQTGAFWDETIYSSKSLKPKAASLASLKGYGTDYALDPIKYGGYDKVQQAYYFAFSAVDKKGNRKGFFEGVPIHLVDVIEESDQSLIDYAERIAQKSGCSQVKILRKKIQLRQKFLLDGDEFYLYGRTELRNEFRPAKELAFSPVQTKVIKKVLALSLGDVKDEEVPTGAELREVYKLISSSLEKTNMKLTRTLDLESRYEAFCALNKKEAAGVIKTILEVSNGASKECNLSLVNGSKKAGCMKTSLGAVLANIVWVDQSVTGLFEKRSVLEL